MDPDSNLESDPEGRIRSGSVLKKSRIITSLHIHKTSRPKSEQYVKHQNGKTRFQGTLVDVLVGKLPIKRLTNSNDDESLVSLTMVFFQTNDTHNRIDGIHQHINV